MQKSTIFSIIIPFKNWSSDLEECLVHIQKLSFREFEVILLPDKQINLPETYKDLALSIIPTGSINPALKRDRGARVAKSPYLAFIDDDAYPEGNWLDIAYKTFSSRSDIGAIGGPATTPASDPFWARVSGAVFLSFISGGFPERYVAKPPARAIEDWPSVNLIVCRETFEIAGGFDSAYWPGEDTLFCLKILNNTDKLIYYVPELRVWHHRRSNLVKHLRQIGNYGLHRGYFSKVYPENSRKFKYFVPSLWVLFVFLGLFLSVIFPDLIILYSFGWITYLVALVISWKDINKYEPILIALSSTPYTIMTHLWYGIKFIEGLATKSLKSSMGR